MSNAVTMQTIAESRAYRLRWWILLVLAVSILVIVLSSSMINIALPTLQRELGTTMTDLQWIINAYMLTLAGLMLTMGALGDRWGRSVMLNAGICVFGFANLGAVFAETSVQLIICRGVMGLGGAMILPATLAIITSVFPEEERGRAIGIWAGLNSIGIALGPIIGGLLVQHFRWNSIFLLNLPFALVAAVAGMLLIPNSKDPKPRPVDVPGTLLSIVSLAALIFGLVQGGAWGWSHPAVVGCLAGAAAAIAAFILWELRAKHPMLDLSIFRRARFASGVVAVSIMSLALVGVTFSLTLFMQFVKSYGPLQTGVRFLPLAFGIFLGAGSADRLVQRLGTKRVMVIGFAGVSFVAIFFGLASYTAAYWKLGLMFFGLGLFLGYIAAPATEAVMGALPKARAGIGSAVNTVARMVAGSIGVAALGSALSSVYTARFVREASGLPGLPEEIMGAAKESVGAGVILAGKLPQPLGDTVAHIAKESFMDGWHVMAYIAIALCLLGAFIMLSSMPDRRE